MRLAGGGPGRPVAAGAGSIGSKLSVDITCPALQAAGPGRAGLAGHGQGMAGQTGQGRGCMPARPGLSRLSQAACLLFNGQPRPSQAQPAQPRPPLERLSIVREETTSTAEQRARCGGGIPGIPQ